jgi:hypothetical protein
MKTNQAASKDKMKTNQAATKKAHSFPFKRVGIGIAVILIDVMAISLMLYFGKERAPGNELTKLGYDTIRISIQLILVGVFGGIFIQEYNRFSARKSAMNDFRRTMLRELSRAYSDIKGVRRMLRGKCQPISNTQSTGGGDCLLLADYDEHITIINSTQLELEILVRELRIIKEVFRNTKKLIDNINIMEKYIGKIVDEYEIESKNYRSSGSVPLSKLPHLNSLIAKNDAGRAPDTLFEKHKIAGGDDSDYFGAFVNSYKNALIIIQKESIKVA